MKSAKTFGERVRAAYLAKGLNRSQLARALGVSYTTVIAWEKDRSVPTLENLETLSVVVGVHPSVLRGEGSPVTEADYEAWRLFLDSEIAKDLAPHERRTLASMRFDDPPTVAMYTAVLFALRGSHRSTI